MWAIKRLVSIALLLFLAVPAGAQDLLHSNTVASGANGSANGALQTIICHIPYNAGTLSLWCDWKAASGTVAPTFDTIMVRNGGISGTPTVTGCSPYPTFEITDVTQSTHSSTVTANSTFNSTAISAKLASSTATDQFDFEVSTAGTSCTATAPNNGFDVSITVRE